MFDNDHDNVIMLQICAKMRGAQVRDTTEIRVVGNRTRSVFLIRDKSYSRARCGLVRMFIHVGLKFNERIMGTSDIIEEPWAIGWTFTFTQIERRESGSAQGLMIHRAKTPTGAFFVQKFIIIRKLFCSCTEI